MAPAADQPGPPAAPAIEHHGGAIVFVPIRHHSPVCAQALLALLAEVAPRQVLIEAPIDFESMIGVLVDDATRPPVAVVALPQQRPRTKQTVNADDGDNETVNSPPHPVSYFPFCAHSPEYLAIRWASAHDARLSFIDLPSRARVMRSDAGDFLPQLPLTGEGAMTHSGYVAALCSQSGCRDHNELWDHLFEQRLGTATWRNLLTDVAVYGAHVRATIPSHVLDADGTIAREQHMAQRLAESLARPERPIVIVTGAMHTPALIEALDTGAAPKPAKRRTASAGKGAPGLESDRSEPVETRAFLVRYGLRELDRLNGYGAGMASPGWYHRVWSASGNAPSPRSQTAKPKVARRVARKLESSARPVNPWQAAATTLLLELRTRIATEFPGLALALPALANALEQAVRLADLRGHPGPSRQDVIDAATSAFIKGEVTPGADPVLAALAAMMTGDELGDVPPSAGSPPLVESVRATARRLGFDLSASVRRKRELDIYRRERHLAASRFLHAMAFLETSFGNRISGPDILGGHDRDILFEAWTTSWSPQVEARLIELSAEGDEIEVVAARRLHVEALKLADAGNGRNARVAVRLLLTACLIGVQSRVSTILRLIAANIEADPDLASVTGAASELFLLWRSRAVLGLTGSADLESLIAGAYRRALYLMEGIADTSEERLGGVVGALATLREVVASASAEGGPGDDTPRIGDPMAQVGARDRQRKMPILDPSLFADEVVRLLEKPMPPVLGGALSALAYLSGHRDGGDLVSRIRGGLGGACVDIADRVAALNGMLAVTRELLWRVPHLLDAIDDTITSLDDERFIAALPHLRLGFAALDPREIDEVATRIGVRRGGGANPLAAEVSYDIGEAEVAANLALATELERNLSDDGLASWLRPPLDQSATPSAVIASEPLQ